MKHYVVVALLFLLCVTQLVQAQVDKVVPNPPSPPRLVNDFTGNFLTHDQADALERKLVAYDDSTSNQIAIVIVNSLEGYSRDDYAVALARKWGVGGQKEFNNGVVILVKPKTAAERGEVFIAVGYGLEGAVTDLVADQIVQSAIIPQFSQGNNYRALDIATNEIIDAAAGRYQAPDGYNNRDSGRGSGLFIAAIVFFIIIIIISRKGGGGGGGYVSRRGYRDDWGGPIILPGNWGGSSGGGWSGGGGGFGGFGGGGFGGGGAGGSW